MQNKAAVMHGTHDVRLEDVPVPDLGPKEVTVEIRASLVVDLGDDQTGPGAAEGALRIKTACSLRPRRGWSRS
jgi:hypothetical protein